MILLLASLAAGSLMSLLVFPSTLREICSAGDMGGHMVHHTGVAHNAVWSLILLVVTTTLLASALSSRNKNRGRSELQAESSFAGLSFNEVVKCLSIFFILRYFVQIINAGRVMIGSDTKGSFAEMLIVENMMEHGQLIVLLLVLVNDHEFSTQVTDILHQIFPWLATPSSADAKPSMFRHSSTVYIDQVFNHAYHADSASAEHQPRRDEYEHENRGDEAWDTDSDTCSEASSVE